MKSKLLLALASAGFFVASAQAQNAGTVTSHAFAIGKGAGVSGYTSLLCGSAQLAVGQSAADPICKTITGDVTISAAGVTALGNIPSGATLAGSLLASAIAAPSTPAAGKDSVWVDSTDKRLHDKNDAGTIGTTVVADTGAANNFLTAVSAAGAISKARPACANLSDASVFCNGTSAASLTDTLNAAQEPAHTGDVTNSAGSLAMTIVPNAVANAKMATMAANTVKANATGGSAVPTDVTAATARSSSLLNVDSFTGHGDSIYTILATDRTVGTNAAFTASRTWTLPAANAVNPGQEILVADFQGTVTGVNTLVISRAGADTVNGGTTVTISAANGAYLLKSDGSSKWTAQSMGSASAGALTNVTPGGGLVSSISAACSQTAITASGTLSVSRCVNAQTGTSYAIVDGDRGKLVTASNASAQAYTIAQAGTASAFQSGWTAEIQNIGTVCTGGVVTITATTSTIMVNGSAVSSFKIYPGQSGELISDGTNYIWRQYGGSNWVCLNTLTASNSAQLVDTTSLTSQFSEYEIVLEDIISVTANVSCQLQVHSGGSFQATSYATAQLFGGAGGAGGNATPTTYVPCSIAGAVSSFPTQGSIRVNNPSASAIHQFMATFASSQSGPSNFIGGGAGFWNSAAVVDGFLVQMSSGNFSGKVKIYARL